MTEDEMVELHHLPTYMSLSKFQEFVMDIEAVCCSPWGCKELDMLND